MPKFTTPISISGPDRNIFVVCGTARAMMRQLGRSEAELAALTNAVMTAGSYETALDAVREWFPVEGGDE
jgi:predicted benzoate:H+ symporter BenE